MDEIFTVTSERGFLPCSSHALFFAEIPSPVYPDDYGHPYYMAWESLGDDLPKLLIAGGEISRPAIISRLPPISSPQAIAALLSERPSDELERVLLLLSFIAHAYVWGRPGDVPVDVLPSPLASAWIEASRLRGGRPPILTYASFNLYNWRRLDKSRPVALGNLACNNNFLSGMDDEWFRHVHIEIEQRASHAVAAIMTYQRSRDREDLLRALAAVRVTLGEIQSVLSRMGEGCDPYIYHHRVRTWMSGWRNNPQLPLGLMYEGHGRMLLYGETGAQSAIIPSMDAFLGITHEHDSMREYLLAMKDYMPAPHQAFLKGLEDMTPSVREVVEGEKDHPDSLLPGAYDEAVKALARFRSQHLGYADRYIRQPVRQEKKKEEKVGTGGTDFVIYLAKHCRETKAHLLKEAVGDGDGMEEEGGEDEKAV